MTFQIFMTQKNMFCFCLYCETQYPVLSFMDGWTKTFFKIYFAFHRRKKGCKGAHNSKETNLWELNHVLSYLCSLVLLPSKKVLYMHGWTHFPSRAEIEMFDCCFIWFRVMCLFSFTFSSRLAVSLHAGFLSHFGALRWYCCSDL